MTYDTADSNINVHHPDYITYCAYWQLVWYYEPNLWRDAAVKVMQDWDGVVARHEAKIKLKLSPATATTECPDCMGSGYVLLRPVDGPSKKCSNCNGRGRMMAAL